MRNYGILLLSVVIWISGCQKQGVGDESMWQICDTYPDICDATHSGALCSIPRADAIRHMAIQRENVTSITTYTALLSLDTYRECLEDAYISEAVRNKSDKQSQIVTIRNIPEIQKKLLASTRQMTRPEINLWLWSTSQRDDHWESMVNGFDVANEVHPDVLVAMMTHTAREDLSKALEFARSALDKAEVIDDIKPAVYEFYVRYHLEKEDLHKAAVWQGLYSAKDAEKAEVNRHYFKLYEKMTNAQIEKAQDQVDDLLFDAKWLNKDMTEFPKSLI